FLGTLNIDPQSMKQLLLWPPYREIRHTLSGPRSVACWTRHQQFEYHMTFPYAHMSRESLVWNENASVEDERGDCVAVAAAEHQLSIERAL
ncbi:hypothetical protein HAX54_040735, partial [Datura stramonium]|nr:hypothetical protein [Datura stramonium]